MSQLVSIMCQRHRCVLSADDAVTGKKKYIWQSYEKILNAAGIGVLIYLNSADFSSQKGCIVILAVLGDGC